MNQQSVEAKEKLTDNRQCFLFAHFCRSESFFERLHGNENLFVRLAKAVDVRSPQKTNEILSH